MRSLLARASKRLSKVFASGHNVEIDDLHIDLGDVDRENYRFAWEDVGAIIATNQYGGFWPVNKVGLFFYCPNGTVLGSIYDHQSGFEEVSQAIAERFDGLRGDWQEVVETPVDVEKLIVVWWQES